MISSPPVLTTVSRCNKLVDFERAAKQQAPRRPEDKHRVCGPRMFSDKRQQRKCDGKSNVEGEQHLMQFIAPGPFRWVVRNVGFKGPSGVCPRNHVRTAAAASTLRRNREAATGALSRGPRRCLSEDWISASCGSRMPLAKDSHTG